MKLNMQLKLILSLVFLFLSVLLFAQKEESSISTKEEFEAQYKKNISKTRLNGMYIPGDIPEAIERIKELTDPSVLQKFAAAPEDVVVPRLHFSLGKWMILNYNFYDGSRLSHHLKQKGVLHPDDMATFLITVVHRSLNKKELNEEKLIEDIAKERKAIADKLKENHEFLDSMTIQHDGPK